MASVAEVAAAVETVPERYRLAILLAAWCQLRRGQVLELQRRDVDLLHGTIRIDRAVVRPMDGSTVVGPPKTSAGSRVLAVPANVLPDLPAHLERFVAARPDAWLFTSEAGGPMVPAALNRVWQRARRAIGRGDLHYQDLRQSGLTWAAASGASVVEPMRRGGHANPVAAPLPARHRGPRPSDRRRAGLPGDRRGGSSRRPPSRTIAHAAAQP